MERNLQAWGLLAALTLVFSGCASVRPEPDYCQAKESYDRGARDAAQGLPANPDFIRFCKDTQLGTLESYHNGYESQRRIAPVAPPAPLARPVLARKNTWVCEVEASRKVFTGVGASQDEALRSAKDTCGSHFQASYCTQTECKQSL